MIDFSIRPRVMGVINVTPDSFYAGSRVRDLDTALRIAEQMIQEGASIIDIGGESTQPLLDLSETQVSLQEELDRVLPIIKAIHERFDILISIDTSKAEVMSNAVEQGAKLINDQRALQYENALEMAASLRVSVCLMQMYGAHARVPNSQPYSQTLQEIKIFLLDRVEQCLKAGIKKEQIIIDPGFGHGNYGKSTEENLYLLKHLSQFVETGYPVLVGFSRKTMIGKVLGLPVEKRLYASLGLAVLAAINGAAIIRTHDVGATQEAIKMAMTAWNISDIQEKQ
jgi:dihydropteroate synthase